ncbi:CPBP family intramembrane glutamic endopeptidase [Flavobacteriaceae bacterium S356]|uniref:CPBP family intramembrane glutamic endopeptidase n=1 Tax=Asprobacillus argus TaxID=3076534 RepID=A0ABU3LIQ6_9FLAO|nr:CPBP family intramembrane glutamic endopeptidase [Flavobacteriaceae bacterium S356]
MLGLLVIVAISWILLHFIQKEGLDALGIVPNRVRVYQFFVGFVAMMLIVLLTISIESFIAKIQWSQHSQINYTSIFNAFVYHLRSALTEDLVFRGAILYILIKRAGVKKALLLSAISFGIYHVFSYGMVGSDIIPILYVVLVTGLTGYIWAYLFYKSKSIMMPLGFHIGYNLTMSLFFENQPYGELLFKEISRIHLSEWNGFLLLLFKGIFPSIVTVIAIKVTLAVNRGLKDSRTG